ncbi:MAG: diguanylate cyclase [Gemmatimonadetes bacterium]|uniref:Diguanylate cyclase n=1 Tax=Candidatus Kutchimonas denitrificans TaxID=3056748 RepID=A0AAE4Z846_9BACT|nr:diguanylate cyclase [Gemmatimonadota bacterium]NIR74227.1 diguanylate cyclase [Candidatus Kutchimonas denitrificans]NIR99849.1 diguanylate cyclase [Gemmatimonadota bacterium]NIT65438.1 diguanylate cyclase [Gemmatimonadota bacterium]NIU51803.1 diguanylate cyclase [Gemmatimonadota bacterium]
MYQGAIRQKTTSLRTSLHQEAAWLGVALRVVVLAVGIFWLDPEPQWSDLNARILAGLGAYNAVLALAAWRRVHPALWMIGLVDFAGLTVVLILEGAPATTGLFVFAFLVLVLTLAYGWRGAALGLACYVAAESAVLLASTAPAPAVWELVVRIGSGTVAAAVFAGLVERHELLGLRVSRAILDHPIAGVTDLQEFTNALGFLHKLAVRGRWPYSVLVIDIGKPGAPSGHKGPGIDERVLQRLASEALAALRTTDIVGRVGADVFAVALPDTPRSGAAQVARRIEQRLQARAHELEYMIGLAEIRPSRKNDYDECLHAAFADVRRAKEVSHAAR